MAGTSLGASAPASLAPAPSPIRTLHRVPATTRTRLNHGVFLVGDQLAAVYSSRRGGERKAVVIELGAGPLMVTGTMSAKHARTMARALIAAAELVDPVGGVA